MLAEWIFELIVGKAVDWYMTWQSCLILWKSSFLLSVLSCLDCFVCRLGEERGAEKAGGAIDGRITGHSASTESNSARHWRKRARIGKSNRNGRENATCQSGRRTSRKMCHFVVLPWCCTASLARLLCPYPHFFCLLATITTFLHHRLSLLTFFHATHCRFLSLLNCPDWNTRFCAFCLSEKSFGKFFSQLTRSFACFLRKATQLLNEWTAQFRTRDFWFGFETYEIKTSVFRKNAPILSAVRLKSANCKQK